MMKQLDFFNLINKNFASQKDVQNYLKCDVSKSYHIFEKLKSIAIKNRIKLLNSKEVPMQIFIDYFHINKELTIKYHNSLLEFGYI